MVFSSPKGEIFGWNNGTTLLCENKGTYSTFPHSTHPLFFHASWTKTQTKVGKVQVGGDMTQCNSVMITITIMQCNVLANFILYQVIHGGTSETKAGGHI